MAHSSNSLNNEEFLPAALEILESPPSPLGRLLILVIAAFFALLVGWAWIGKVDVIVVGQGRVIPSGHTKTIQPFESGVVTRIHVIDGQFVKEGQVLLELDPTDTNASVNNLKAQLEAAQVDLAVATALLADDPPNAFNAPDGVNASKVDSAKKEMLSIHLGQAATIQEISAERARLTAQLSGIEIEVQKISDTLPVLESRVAAAGTLLARDAMRQDDRLSLEQSIIELHAARKNLAQSRLQILASLDGLAAQEQKATAGFFGAQSVARRDAESRKNALENQVKSELRRNQYRYLVAPVAGYVDQLTIHTLGGVLSAGQPIMNIVPKDSRKEIEAYILNKDIGFIRVGDVAEIKLDAFPFTKFGVLEGSVETVSKDAATVDQLGLVYKMSVVLTTPQSNLDDRQIEVTPGMNVAVEVITEKRRIIDYFISPLLRYKDEAIRER
jgi:hemolysin D